MQPDSRISQPHYQVHYAGTDARFVAPRTRAFIEFLLASLDAQHRPTPGVSVGLHTGLRGWGED